MVWLRSVRPDLDVQKSQFKTSRGVLLDYAYFDRKSPISLVFVNGWGTTYPFEWSNQMSLPFNLLFHNSRGMGKSTIDDEPYLDACARDLSELVNHLGIKSAHYVAHSMGGLVISRFNRAYSDDLSHHSFSLVCSPSGNPLESFPLSPFVPNNLDPLLRSFSGGVLGLAASAISDVALIRMIVHRTFALGGLRVDPDSFKELYENVLRNRPAVSAALSSMINHGNQFAADFDHIGCPALIISGGRDFFVSPTAVARLSSRIPSSNHVLFDDCTHAPMFESPAKFNRVLADFVLSVHQESGDLPIAG